MAPRRPNPYIEPSVAVVTYGLALVAISLKYALLLHTVTAHTPISLKCPRTHCSFTPCLRIPRTEYPELNLGAPLLEARAPLDLVRTCPECASEQYGIRNSATPVSSQKRTCHVPHSTPHVCVAFTACAQKRTYHVPYSTTHVCVAFTAYADTAAVCTPSSTRPTDRCAQDPCRTRVKAHVLVAVAARSVRVRKHSAVEQRLWLCSSCSGDCHASVSSRTQCGPCAPSAAYSCRRRVRCVTVPAHPPSWCYSIAPAQNIDDDVFSRIYAGSRFCFCKNN